MRPRRSLKPIARFIAYVLGRRPDEFGLVPDDRGFYAVKELLKALAEEEAGRGVNAALLKEILLTVPEPPFEMDAGRIRARQREFLPGWQPAPSPPKLLFVCVRSKAHRHVVREGVAPSRHPWVLLADSEDMARRIGRRSDADPVLLTVNTQQLTDRGTGIERYGQTLYRAAGLPPGTFSAPALPPEPPPPKTTPVAATPKTPGSYLVDLETRLSAKGPGPKRGRKEIEWKKARRQAQKTKKKFDNDF